MSDTTGTPRKLYFTPKHNRFFRNKKHAFLVPDRFLSESEPEPEPIPELEELQGNQRRRRQRRRRRKSPLPSDPHIRIAMYVAMAHGGLALSLALLFGVAKLMQNFWRPIQWAILCSIPLRELHTALVSFWSHSLNLGLFETLTAIPIWALNVTTSSLMDSQSAFLRLLRYRPSVCKKTIGFSKLMQWLISFGLFIVLYERIGLMSIPTFVFTCFIGYVSGFGRITIKRLSSISSRKFRSNSSSFGLKISRYLTSVMLNRLKTMVGIGLITFMLVGSVLGLIFFSYKIAMEGKVAVISLKVHLDENNYAERIGLKNWMDENQMPEMIDSYATKLYETVSQNVDSLAVYYNVTEIVDGVRQYLVSPSQTSVISSVSEKVNTKPLSERLNDIQSNVRDGEWKVIYRDVNGVFREFLSVITREDLLEKIKSFLLQSLDVSKRLVASSTMVLASGANIVFFMTVSIVSGAAGLLNFISGLMVFLWLLYYLITTDSGGVTDHVLGMLPLSKSTRVRCAQVLDHAVSSVLLSAAKVIFFQGCFTYLLFRFYRIHFLYMSTFLALMSAALPITPAWLSSIPAAAQLAMESRYIEAVLLTIVHQILLDYGTIAIQDEIPGQNAYLTGLSILGGIALFPSALEGAIMGPLLMTVMIALKNLYVEFVLGSSDETSQ
ncbi:Transmembrane protein [Quillaja saponaria]|uniref:Transmembrane protein n=1 Tax=Quillaja saponaria TaxID=32244 RepID=A0AAD7Q4D2_QUISA|nr:Transmembrane protein [Quillaja saponaria]